MADSPCSTNYSLGFQLSYRYLNARGIKIQAQGEHWLFGQVLVQRVKSSSAGYQRIDGRGNQILLNYRRTSELKNVAREITFRDILKGEADVLADLLPGRVVLIGVTAASVQDAHDTPYGRTRGIYIHAHLVSQIINAVESPNRPLLWWWSWWQDGLWIWGWSLTGGLIIGFFRQLSGKSLGIVVVVFSLYGLCWFGLSQSGWLPLFPSFLAVLGSSSLISVQHQLIKQTNI